MVVKASGLALSSEMAEMSYEVDYYFHGATKDDLDSVTLDVSSPVDLHQLAEEVVRSMAHRRCRPAGRSHSPAPIIQFGSPATLPQLPMRCAI
jgi:hypothetical protein